MKSSLIALILLSGYAAEVSARPIFADEDDYTAPRSATIPTTGATSIRIDARAGTLRIEGREGITEVRARGTARASSRSLLEDIKLIAEREGNEVVIRAELPESQSNWSWSRRVALDLVIEVPNTIALDVSDSSGDVEIRGTAALDIEDSSGNLTIENVAGALNISDSSGEIVVRGARGDVTIEDSSGGIEVHDVTGSMTVDRDSSGEIEATRVSGGVLVRSDGSGGIDVDDVGGDFVVRKDGSGGINYHNVKGKIELPGRRGR